MSIALRPIDTLRITAPRPVKARAIEEVFAAYASLDDPRNPGAWV